MPEEYYKYAYGTNPADRKDNEEIRSSETSTSTNARTFNIEVKDKAISL